AAEPAPTPAAPKGPPPDLPLPTVDPSRWALYGRVYDLSSLAPAPNVMLTFRASDGSSFSATSDQLGRYAVALNRSTGYDVLSDDPNFARETFHETDIPYARLSEPERADLIQNARTGDIHSTPLTDITGGDSFRLDLFVAPRR
ncbi:MAG: hypothetical protein KGM24_06670, partial [Elusimicrobia bacterium]|nr:hypothetical protein [Elusimicrobiota bacterium]